MVDYGGSKVDLGCQNYDVDKTTACEEEKNRYWGYHLILDCQGCDVDKITSREHVYNFIKVLVKDIDMVAYKEPIIEHFATHDPEAAGFSFVQLIETSAITGHLVDKNGDAYLDIFSCKSFDIEIAKKIVKKCLNPKKMKVTFLTRQA